MKNLVKRVFMAVIAMMVVLSIGNSAYAADYSIYTARDGDSYWAISYRFNMDYNSFLQLNGLTPAQAEKKPVHTGDKFKVKKSSSAATKSTGSVSTNKKTTAYSSYTVKNGDTLTGIAKKFGMSYSNFLKLNGLTVEKANKLIVHTGDKFKVGKNVSDTAAKSARKSDNTNAKKSTCVTYTVKNGDTLTGIAKKFGMSYSNFLKLNGLTVAKANSMTIHTGDKFKIKSMENPKDRFASVGKKAKKGNYAVVNKKTHKFYLYDKSGNELFCWTCSTAREGCETKSGKYTMTMIGAKNFYNTTGEGKELKYKSNDPANPYYRCIWVKGPAHGFIHGTGGWLKLGGDYSLGCVRLSDENMKTLIEYVIAGDTVMIVK